MKTLSKKSVKETLENLGYVVLDCCKLESIAKVLVYSKTDDCRTFFSSCVVEKGKIVYNGNTYKTVQDFIDASKAYNETLPYPIYCYDESFNKQTLVWQKVNYYLKNVLNFEKVDGIFDNTGTHYIYKYGMMNSLKLRIEDCYDEPDVVGRVCVTFPDGYFISHKYRDEDECIATINAIIKAETLSVMGSTYTMLNNLSDALNLNIETAKFDLSSFSFTKKDFKEVLKTNLEKILKEIEQN